MSPTFADALVVSPSSWSTWPHLRLIQDRGGDGNSVVFAALYLFGLSVTEMWDESHDIGNDIFGAFTRKKLLPFMLVTLVAHNIWFGQEKDRDMRWGKGGGKLVTIKSTSALMCKQHARKVPPQHQQWQERRLIIPLNSFLPPSLFALMHAHHAHICTRACMYTHTHTHTNMHVCTQMARGLRAFRPM